MTLVAEPPPPSKQTPSSPAPTPNSTKAPGPLSRLLHWRPTKKFGIEVGKWLVVYAASLVIFGAFVSVRHVHPWTMYHAMWSSTFTRYGMGQVLIKAGPFVLAALAVAVPARAGIINIGGEGQLVIGATAAGGVGLALQNHATGVPAMVLMALAAAAAGAAWAGLAAVLKLAGNVSEAISTLLLNYIGVDVLAYLVYGPWKDKSGNGQPASKPMARADFLPTVHVLKSHAGILIAVVAALVVGWALTRTRWGFSLRAVGGNPEAARRAGLAVAALMLSAMLVGGALAGLGGMVQYAGIEGQLRPGLAAGYGYTGFLASWVGRHHAGKVTLAALLLSTIAVAGDSLSLSSHLPGGAVNVLMALVLLAVLAKRTRTAAA